MTDLETAKSQLQKAKVHVERVYPTDQLQKAVEDLQEMLPLNVSLPDSTVDGPRTLEGEVNKIISPLQAAETFLQTATYRIQLLQNLLNSQ